MHNAWAENAFFYHIYPLGLCGAPRQNDFQSQPVARLDVLYPWLDHIQRLGANALYLGPLFESGSHGYDTADYYHVDRRLGDRHTLAAFSRELHRRGMRLVLDGVFNHVGRDFWAFRDLRAGGAASAYADWFSGLDFSQRSPYGDPFAYEGWSGHFSLAKLNLANPAVRRHLFDAVTMWVETFDIDGIRLDAADQLDTGFLDALSSHARGLRSDIWLMGEIVFGDYRRLTAAGRLDSATNYEVYKGLYSSHNDVNYFELAYALNRQWGPGGVYTGSALYNFADNHDVNRVASSLKNPAHLYPLNILLFTIPGIPSIYYGSEWGIAGERTPHSDTALRPTLDLSEAAAYPVQPLPAVVARLAALRNQLAALRGGDYQQLHVSSGQLAFQRGGPGGLVVVAVNALPEPAVMEFALSETDGSLVDLLNPGSRFPVRGGRVQVPLDPAWGRVMAFESAGGGGL